MWLRKGSVKKSFKGHMVRKRGDGKYCNDHVIKERGDKVLELEFVSVD
jgi:hypothetical protein